MNGFRCCRSSSGELASVVVWRDKRIERRAVCFLLGRRLVALSLFCNQACLVAGVERGYDDFYGLGP